MGGNSRVGGGQEVWYGIPVLETMPLTLEAKNPSTRGTEPQQPRGLSPSNRGAEPQQPKGRGPATEGPCPSDGGEEPQQSRDRIVEGDKW